MASPVGEQLIVLQGDESLIRGLINRIKHPRKGQSKGGIVSRAVTLAGDLDTVDLCEHLQGIAATYEETAVVSVDKFGEGFIVRVELVSRPT